MKNQPTHFRRPTEVIFALDLHTPTGRLHIDPERVQSASHDLYRK
jgi:hypothetical protein